MQHANVKGSWGQLGCAAREREGQLKATELARECEGQLACVAEWNN